MTLTLVTLLTAAVAYTPQLNVRYSHRWRNTPAPTCCVAVAAPEELATIAAAPQPSTAAFDLAEQLSTQSLPHGPWRHAFRGLMTDPKFVEHGWAKQAFKLTEKWNFAIDITLLPPQFVAHGIVAPDGGIYNTALEDGFTFADVDAAMETATVVMLNAGFLVPACARVSLAMLEVSQLPIWLNVYLSKPGLTRSTQLHTDKQDVLLVQTTGRKRWRVYRPPPPQDTPQHDPFARGKGTDAMDAKAEELLIDTIMCPGEVLYIPAGFPHATDTVGAAETPSTAAHAAEPSVHLTVGVDTHLWGLTYARMREVALDRAGEAVGLPGGLPLTHLALDRWRPLHEPLPVGFRAAPALAALCTENEGRAAAVGLADASATLCEAMAAECAQRMLAAEPERWAEAGAGADADAASLVERYGLVEVAARMVAHHRDVLGVQASMYRRTAASSDGAAAADPVAAPRRSDQQTVSTLFAEMDALDAHMERLEGWGRGVEMPPPPAAADGAAGRASSSGGSTSGFGGGGGGMGGGKKAGGANKKAKKKKKK